MPSRHNFQGLKNFATKKYKFKQEYSIGALRPGNSLMGDSIGPVELSPDEFNEIKRGVCAALAAAWVEEQRNPPQRPQFAGAVPGDVHVTRNRDTVLDVLPKFHKYVQAGPNGSVLDEFGFEKLTRNPSGVMVTAYSPTTCGPVATPAPSLEKACSPEFLKPGRAVFVEFSVWPAAPGKQPGRHAVAAFRSLNGALYFFDPNCGVYAVNDERNFFGEYVKCYASVKYEIQFNLRDGFTYIDK